MFISFTAVVVCCRVVRFLDLGPARFRSRMIQKINRRIKKKNIWHNGIIRFTRCCVLLLLLKDTAKVLAESETQTHSSPKFGACLGVLRPIAGHGLIKAYPQPAIMATSSLSESGAHMHACVFQGDELVCGGLWEGGVFPLS